MADEVLEPLIENIKPEQVSLTKRSPLALLRTSFAEDLLQAADLGFTHALLKDQALLGSASDAGLVPVLEVVLAPAPGGLELEGLAYLLKAGVAGFYFHNAQSLASAEWADLLEHLREQQPEVLLLADLFGASPAQAAALAGAGFNFATCSSCYWDFSAGWLNGDCSRTELVAPALAFASPDGASGWTPEAALRALRFSAVYAPAWVVEREMLFAPELAVKEEVRALLALRRAIPALHGRAAARLLSTPHSAIAVLEREGFVCAVNPSLARPALLPAQAILPTLAMPGLLPQEGAAVTAKADITLPAGGVAYFTSLQPESIILPTPKLDVAAPRIAIEAITPQVDDGSFPVRRILGELVSVEADLLSDGHDKLAGELLWREGKAKSWKAVPLRPLGNDRWQAEIPLERLGRHGFVISAWKDRYASFVDEVSKKHAAGLDTTLELREGMALVEEAARTQARPHPLLPQLTSLTENALRDALLGEELQTFMRLALPKKFLVKSHEVMLDAEPRGAAFASWYEIFPRSQAGDGHRHGNFNDVIAQMPRIARMGFDVLYFPPIHPIGKANRKGKNNSLQAQPGDPGSPYAIGSVEGGHDALHPALGTLDDFRALVRAGKQHGLDIAIDFAIQCAPDHPWLQEHKGWFDWRADGTIKYAENPPKKYEDIVNVDFYAEEAKPGLWLALRDVVQFWVDQGIRYFRVDNPHTKPLPFWQWMIADIRARHPDVIFLAEAFTRPKLMYRLAKIGFSQSYTYFTWRNTKAELTAYLNELSNGAPKDFFRPHFFVNTPDINPVFLHQSGRGGFLIRAALAATLSGLFGVYNGFELCEATPVAAGKEEYLNSEKYELKAWDYDRPGNIVAEITALNRVRRENMALHSHLGIEFLHADNDQVLYFRKFAADGSNLLIAIGLDPHQAQSATIELPLWRFGLADDGALAAHDLLRDIEFTWHGKYQPVLLDPNEFPYCIWRVAPATRTI